MKHPEDMTKEELQEYIEQAVKQYFQNSIKMGRTPYFNIADDIIYQLINYSRN